MSFVGYHVSLDCGDVLGTYQGRVEYVDPTTQSITITKAYRNGLQCKVNQVCINANDIKDLKIVGQAQKKPLSNGVDRKAMRREAKENKQVKDGRGASPTKVVNPNMTTMKSRNSPRTNSEERKKPRSYVHMNTKRGSPSCYNRQDDYQGRGSGSNRSTPNDEYVDVRGPSNSLSEYRRKPQSSSSPRKIEMPARRRTPREDCFSAPAESILSDEFDFEKNLAMFDKQAVFEEIETTGYPGIVMRACEAKYKNDENVIPSKPIVFNQIQVPNSVVGGGGGSCCAEYVTDTGLVVPTVSYEMRCKLLSLAEQYGLSLERQVEMVGRSAAEMVLQLLGGNLRLNPQNSHQKPSVVVLCGPHLQGAQGVNCARHLSAHGVKTTVFMPSFMKVMQELHTETQLYELTDGKRINAVKDLPSTPVDMIVNALNSHENQMLQDQAWFKAMVAWTNDNKAHVVTVDPPCGGCSVQTKWSLAVAMPLALPDSCGQVYLCDLSLPNKVYKDVSITYKSPFGHKFIIPLHKHA